MKGEPRIAYKEIPQGRGCVYVFSVWAGGIMACYRMAMYTSGTHTPVYNHNLQTDAGGNRYILIQHRLDGKMKVYLSNIKRAPWKRQRIPYASEQTGISVRTMHRIRGKIKMLAQQYPNHAMLKQSLTKPAKKKAKSSSTRPRKAIKTNGVNKTKND